MCTTHRKCQMSFYRTIEGPWHQSQRGPIFYSLNPKPESMSGFCHAVVVGISHACKQPGHKVGVAGEDTTECEGSQLSFEAWSQGSPQTCQTDDFNF